MSMEILSIDEIVSDPAVQHGRPVLRGTGVEVITIAYAHLGEDSLSPEAIASHYRLPLGQVYAALAYYHLHRDQLNQDAARRTETAYTVLNDVERQGKARRIDLDTFIEVYAEKHSLTIQEAQQQVSPQRARGCVERHRT
jgi:uncharacterized protein (DUF433 family)